MKSPRAKAKTLSFRHVHLENWKNFGKVDVALQTRVFLVGPNASGKSNFLDVLRFLQDIAKVGGGFAEAVGSQRAGVTRIRSLSARRYPDIVIRVTVGDEQELTSWTYELGFTQDNQRRPLITRERVAQNGRDLLTRPDAEDQHDRERLFQTYLEQTNMNREFREIAEFFRSILYLHVVPHFIREPERSVGIKDDPFGGDFLEQLASADR
jgi:predicted ATPase